MDASDVIRPKTRTLVLILLSLIVGIFVGLPSTAQADAPPTTPPAEAVDGPPRPDPSSEDLFFREEAPERFVYCPGHIRVQVGEDGSYDCPAPEELVRPVFNPYSYMFYLINGPLDWIF